MPIFRQTNDDTDDPRGKNYAEITGRRYEHSGYTTMLSGNSTLELARQKLFGRAPLSGHYDVQLFTHYSIEPLVSLEFLD